MGHPGGRVLVIDDDPQLAKLIGQVLARENHEVVVAGTAAQGLEALDRSHPEFCILDLNLPDMDGLDVLPKIRQRFAGLPVLVLTGSASLDHAVRAMKLGAYDFLSKPFENEKLLATVRNGLALGDKDREIHNLRIQLKDSYSLEAIIGDAPRMKATKVEADKLRRSDANVLIRGESGTGKELFARAFHFGGARSAKPFIDVNCAALTESILESEIFGHEKGAFTGALARHPGKFEQADGGTIFLDEIGDMPLSTQAKLLRVLQERHFQRVGGTEKIQVDVRVISATNRDLEDMVSKGAFRQDLLFRINTLTLEIPPLRDRLKDLPALVNHFLHVAARREGRAVPEVAPEALQRLEEHRWQGNVRELENVVTRAVILSEGTITEFPVGRVSAGAGVESETGDDGLEKAVERLERRLMQVALAKHGWVKARAARELRITERILAYKMSCYGLERDGKESQVP